MEEAKSSTTVDALNTYNRSWGQPQDSVKRTSPDTENHDKNGYAKVYDDNNIFMTNVDNDNSDTTYKHKHNMREV